MVLQSCNAVKCCAHEKVMPPKRQSVVCGHAIVCIGANLAGVWGEPDCTLRQVVTRLSTYGITVVRSSSLYVTSPIGGGRQPPFLNAVLILRTSHAPAGLIRLFKALERSAGRRKGRRDGPRPLDIDLIDYGGRVLAQPRRLLAQPRRPAARPARPFLVLPHPQMHLRRFVLEPLAEIAPRWQHPLLHASAITLARRSPGHRGKVDRVLDSSWISCEKNGLEELSA